jgi:maleamate amidohydrolase
MSKVWDDIIPEEEIEIYKEAGFGGTKVGMGKKPALIIIDVQYRSVGENKPILDSIRESGYKSSCGELGWKAVSRIQVLLKEVRKQNIPIIYAIVERKDKFDAGRWADKIPDFGNEDIHRVGNKGTEIVKEIEPEEKDIILSKRYASAFFGTHLMTQLNLLGVDTVIVTGATTSGCVRSTVIDAFSYGFKVIVPEDCVYDRSTTSHKVNLFDMNYKYADVISSGDVITKLQELNKVPIEKVK